MVKSKMLYQHLHSRFHALRNCERSGNTEWVDRHLESIASMVSGFLPSGSGWDCGTNYDLDDWSDIKMTFHGSYHHMDNGGSYDGWTEHRITVRPTFDGIDIQISGRDRNGIKEYLGDIFYSALTTSRSLSDEK